MLWLSLLFLWVSNCLVRKMFLIWFTDDPEVPHIHHRDFLKEQVVYKEVRLP